MACDAWPESAVSRDRWGMACKAWPESTISRERWGMACVAWPESTIVIAGVWHSCIGLGQNAKHQCEWLEEEG